MGRAPPVRPGACAGGTGAGGRPRCRWCACQPASGHRRGTWPDPPAPQPRRGPIRAAGPTSGLHTDQSRKSVPATASSRPRRTLRRARTRCRVGAAGCLATMGGRTRTRAQPTPGDTGATRFRRASAHAIPSRPPPARGRSDRTRVRHGRPWLPGLAAELRSARLGLNLAASRCPSRPAPSPAVYLHGRLVNHRTPGMTMKGFTYNDVEFV